MKQGPNSRCSNRSSGTDHWTTAKHLTAAATRTAATTTTAALACLVAVPAKDRAITTRFKRHCCRLAATRTYHRCSLRWGRTVAGASLIVLLCLTAILTTLRGRVTAFLKERLISGGKTEVLPAIAARKLYISGHGSPRGNCTADCTISVQGFHKIENLASRKNPAGCQGPSEWACSTSTDPSARGLPARCGKEDSSPWGRPRYSSLQESHVFRRSSWLRFPVLFRHK
jgi:hypothetical protein